MLAGAPMLTHEDFANLVIRTLRERGEERAIVYEPRGFALHVAPEAEERRTLFLRNVYGEYVSTDDEAARRLLLANVGASAASVDGEETLDEVRVSLMPRVKPRAYFEIGVRLALREAGAAGDGVPHEVLARDLGVSVAIDRAEAIHEVTSFAKWGIDLAGAAEIARINLRRRSDEPFTEIAPGVFASPWGDHYDAERVLLEDKIRALPLSGAPVAMIPSRHRLLLTGEHDAAGLDRVVSEAEVVLEGPRPLTALAFVLRGDGWEPFVPSGEARAARRIRELRDRELAHAYTDQKVLLEQDGEEAFVASVVSAEGVTLGVLTAGVHTLLPMTRLVSLNDMERGAFDVVDFDAFLAVMGDGARLREGLYPPRYEIRSFPSVEEVAEMKRRSSIALTPRAASPARVAPQSSPVVAFGGGAPSGFTAPSPPARGRALGVIGVIGIALLVVRLLLLLAKPSRHYDYKPVYVPPALPKAAYTSKPRFPSTGARTVVRGGAPAAVAVHGANAYFIDRYTGRLSAVSLTAPSSTDPTYGVDVDDAPATRELALLDHPVLLPTQTTMVATADAVYTLRGGDAGAALVRTRGIRPFESPSTDIVATIDGAPAAIALGRTAVYVAVRGPTPHVLEVPLAGGAPRRVVTGVAGPCALAVFRYRADERLYVVDEGQGVRAFPLGRAIGPAPRGEVAGRLLEESGGAACSLSTDLLRVHWPTPGQRAVATYQPSLGTVTLQRGFSAPPVAVAGEGLSLYVLTELDGASTVLRASPHTTPHVVASAPGAQALAAGRTGAVWAAFDDARGGVSASGSFY